MKQTAVEWLISQILAASINKETEEMHITLPKGVFEQAKAMEKEQIRKSYLADAYNSQYGFEQYYNETFKSE
jgi:hypothetical protein